MNRFFLILLICPLIMFSQQTKMGDFYLENDNLWWEKISDLPLDTLSSTELYIKNVLLKNGITEYELIDGKIYYKYYKLLVGKFVNPIDMNVIVSFKDNQYKVQAKNIIFNVEGKAIMGYSISNYTLKSYVIQKNKNEFKTTNIVKKTLDEFDTNFPKILLINQQKDKDDW